MSSKCKTGLIAPIKVYGHFQSWGRDPTCAHKQVSVGVLRFYWENKVNTRRGNEQTSPFYKSNERGKAGLELIEATYTWYSCRSLYWLWIVMLLLCPFLPDSEKTLVPREGVTCVLIFCFVGQREVWEPLVYRTISTGHSEAYSNSQGPKLNFWLTGQVGW